MNYCEEKGISISKLNKAQKKLYLIAEHMKTDKSISEEGYEYFQQAIKALEQEPKTGHWMKSNIGGAKVCSVCNAHMGLSSFKFCPSCGAKMVEPQESEG